MDDPKAMARWAKEMGKSMADETGEELPEDFDEMMENGPPGEGDERAARFPRPPWAPGRAK